MYIQSSYTEQENTLFILLYSFLKTDKMVCMTYNNHNQTLYFGHLNIFSKIYSLLSKMWYFLKNGWIIFTFIHLKSQAYATCAASNKKCIDFWAVSFSCCVLVFCAILIVVEPLFLCCCSPIECNIKDIQCLRFFVDKRNTSFTDEKGSYESRADVVYCVHMWVVEPGHAVIVISCWTVRFWEGPLIDHSSTRGHRVVLFQ